MLVNTPCSLFIGFVLQICVGQELYSFRQTTSALQIYFRAGEWLDVFEGGFDGREGTIVCNISNGTFVEFQRNDLPFSIETVRVSCDDPLTNVEDCELRLLSRNRVVSNVTCFNSSDYLVGDIRLLEDGRIVQLQEVSAGHHAWLHFCTEENLNWDMNVSNLACRTLGYERASGEFISIEGKYVYGSGSIECINATNFLQCESNVLNGKLSDCHRGVIAIECQGLITTQTVSTTSIPTTTQLTTQTTVETTLTSSTPKIPTDSSTTSAIDPTQAAFIDQYKTHIIAGSVAIAFLLLVCVVGSVVFIGICVHKSKSRVESPEEVHKQGMNGEGKEYEAYLSMKPHPNQDTNKYIKSEQLYYNESNEYQHTYLEMQPGQVENSDVSKVEPLYSDILQ